MKLINSVAISSFTTKVLRFLSVGAMGFFVNYFISYSLVHGPISQIWYLYATFIGISVSTTTNFLLNKVFTFKDRNFEKKHTLKQYGFYVLFTLLGALIQILTIWISVEIGYLYSHALIVGVILGSFSNFLLNKKWTFQEKIWY